MITAVDGQTVSSASDVSSIVLTKQPGTSVSVDYTDSYGTSQRATVNLGSGRAQ